MALVVIIMPPCDSTTWPPGGCAVIAGLGVAGHLSRALVLGVVGVLAVAAALTADPRAGGRPRVTSPLVV